MKMGKVGIQRRLSSLLPNYLFNLHSKGELGYMQGSFPYFTLKNHKIIEIKFEYYFII
ncbi:MAG: hypothetical protein QG641_546 [Candidatus Poribacteria bacterium]|nr:hypothetical protein [Candidatus Poribacteria bacterium]MDQ1327266.1 hypothetical protein [Candidatus Poribacteria bacterium]